MQPFFGLLPSAAVSAQSAAVSPSPPVTSSDEQDDGAANDPATYNPDLAIEHSSNSAIIIETGRLRRLYTQNADLKQNIPAASKIMTALIACERLPLNTQVTISKVAVAAEAQAESPDGVILKAGDKYSLEYLLHRLLFYSSDAAALAIAEHISNVEENFVELMNSRAASYDLAGTVFKNCTGEPVFDMPGTQADDQITPAADLQYTTPADLAYLVSQAILNQNFNKILSKDSEYLVLEGNSLISMSNVLHNAWTLSEGKISGAFYSEWHGKTYMVAVGRANGINIIAVTADGEQSSRISDLLALFDGCADNYVSTPLVEAGEKFAAEKEQTVDGEIFGLQYKTTVYYVHPVDDLFLKSTYRYNSYGPFSRPIQRSMVAGQVVIELKDGTTIAVDVVPDRQILSSISILDTAIGELQANRNLFIVILISIVLLLLLTLVQVVTGIGKLTKLVQLIVHEKRSRR